MHGGVAKADLAAGNIGAVKKGLENLGRHIRNTGQFGVPVVVAINHFSGDSADEIDAIKAYAEQCGVEAHVCTHWANGGAGAQDLARAVLELCDNRQSQFRTLYDDDLGLWEKTRRVARTIYGADDIMADNKIRDQFAQFEREGYGHFPVCLAKTQYSFSTDPKLMGAPGNHKVPIRELVLAAGAEFLVVVCGSVMRMPGLPREPAANKIFVNQQGQIEGLF